MVSTMKEGRCVHSVKRLADITAQDFPLVGGKAANIAKLISAGFPVPDGFCVTTAVYRALVDDAHAAELISSLEAIGATETKELRQLAGRIREHIRSKALPADARRYIEELLDGRESYAVRSSATAEDLPHASFAGQHETVLGVTGVEAVTEAVIECMASLFTDRAVAYRAANGIAHSQVSMAVVVQRIIDADASGVLFTADPTTGKRSVACIDAALGAGEAVVSGTITSDNALFDRRSGEIVEYRIGGGEESLESTDAGNGRVLTDEQVRTLVSYGEAIEQVFGSPQDIEWSIAEGRFWMLQARPITTLFPVPVPPPQDGALHVYYSFNHRQGMTRAMPPLVVDYWLRTIRTTLEVLGLRPTSNPMVAMAGGLVYIDLTTFLRSERRAAKLFEALGDFDRQAIVQLRAVRERRRDELARASLLRGFSPPRMLGTVIRLSFNAVGVTGSILRGLIGGSYALAPHRSRKWADRSARKMIGVIRSGATPHDRIRLTLEVNRKWTWDGFRQALKLWNIYFYRAALRRVCPASEGSFEPLERGLRDNVTTAMMLELGDIADIVRDIPAVEQSMTSGADDKTILGIEGGARFASEFAAFLERYGFRAPAEIDFSRPRYNEDPSSLLASIQASLKSGQWGAHRKHLERLELAAEEEISRLEQLAGTGPLGSIRRRLVRPFALRYRSYISMREITKYALSQLLAEMRWQVLAAGEMLEREGGLRDADDVWLFTFDELLSALEHPAKPLGLDLESRRVDYQQHTRLRAPAVITSDGEISGGDASRDDNLDGLAGIPTSGGVAEGIVRVIYEPSDAMLESGEILVAPHTDPGWTPLFLNAAGLITSVGGVMTHGSLVAREYGIPSVVVADATEKLKSGQRVRVDGYRGVVELLEAEQNEEEEQP